MGKYHDIKKEIHDVLDIKDHHDKASRFFNIFLLVLIILNVLAVSLETVKELHEQFAVVFDAFEIISVVIFSLEYILRIWAITSEHKYSHPIYGRIKFLFSFESFIDLLAVTPFYLPMFFTFDLRFIRILRLLRFFRILRLTGYMKATAILGRVFKEKKAELVTSLMVIFFLIIVVSCFMYYAERAAQPKEFTSIPATIWWSVGTLTEVGYGSVYPVTAWGKTLVSIVSILGIGAVALPAGILSSGFSEELHKTKSNHNPQCPHCGKEIEHKP